MAISVVAVGNAAGQSAGTTTTASTVSVTPTLPAGSANTDRIFVTVAANNTSGTTPQTWTALFKDTIIGSGAAGAGTGQRYLSCYYRDYDGVWSMPAFVLTSAAQNTQTVGSIALRRSGTEIWNVPTSSNAGSDFGTPNTTFSATTSTFTTTTGGLLLAVAGQNDNVTMTAGAVTGTNSPTIGTVTERVDGGSATGNDVSHELHTAPVTAAASPAGTLTHTGTLSAASEGGVVFVQQTVSTWTGPRFASVGAQLTPDSTTTTNIAVPPGVVGTTTDPTEVIVVVIYTEQETPTLTTTAAGFVQAPDSPMLSTGAQGAHVLWKRASGADAGTYNFVLSSTGLSIRTAWAMRFTDCVTSGDPFDVTVSATENNASTGAVTTPALSDTTTVDNTLLLWFMTGYQTSTVMTLPTGFTKRIEGLTSGAHKFGDQPDFTAGATGTITGTWQLGFANSRTAWLGALLPVGGAAAPAPLQPRRHLTVAVRRAGFY